MTNSIIDSAVAAFILEVSFLYRVGDDTVFNIFKVVARHGEPADVICAKEPFLMTQAGGVFYDDTGRWVSFWQKGI